MNAEEILITNNGYTETAYAVCGNDKCTATMLRALGVPEKDVVEYLLPSIPTADGTVIDVILLGESDSCEWCACCGTFLRHGITYPGDDVGCKHGEDEPESLPGPHIDLQGNPVMRDFWTEHMGVTP